MKIVSVICARNEEKYLKATLTELRNQTVPTEIVVVDDGSVDATAKIAKEMKCIVVSTPHHNESYVGKPQLSRIWNKGLAEARKLNPDFVHCLGADHVLPPEYIERVLEKMMNDPQIMICSGIIEGEPWEPTTPRGSGRITQAKFWRDLSNLSYPEYWGWESWVLFKAWELGYKCACFKEISSTIARPTKMLRTPSTAKTRFLIPEMYAIGYPLPFIFAKSLQIFLRYPRLGSELFKGWLLVRDLKKLDNAAFVHAFQTRILLKKIMRIFNISHRKE